MSDTTGRHRAPGRFNPLTEIGQIVTDAGSPIAKGSAVLAASGGLVAAIAIPAQAATTDDAGSSASASTVNSATSTPATASVTAPAASKTTKAVSSFGKVDVEPVAKPAGPTPAELRAQREEQERQEAAAAAEAEQVAQEAEQEQEQPAAQEQQQSAPSQSQESSESSGSNGGGSSAPAPSSNASGVIAIAKQYIGTPYVYGGSTPSGFDCSGFTQYVFAKAGKSLPRVTTAQQAAATPVSSPQPGDLVFFGSPSYHVGIYLGDGMMIDAPSTGKSISIRPVFDGVSGYGRV